ncbi:MAG: hypothetical protein NTX85_02330 [Candidatus Nomurabacteria bacterium]|nr:hypothetical protein [Candidatus Nomurabacteria bacterium]
MIIKTRINPEEEERQKEINLIREMILKLPEDEINLIQKGEDCIEEHFTLQQKEGKKPHEIKIDQLNVFNLCEDVPANVMKYLCMLYSAAGYQVSIHGDYFHTEGAVLRTKYPNQISIE